MIIITHEVFWTNCTFNWGIVTNGGLMVGALAFLDEPAAATNVSAVMTRAAVGVRCPFGSFAPHGGWHEGPMYWQYVAEYAQALTVIDTDNKQKNRILYINGINNRVHFLIENYRG